MPKTKIALNDLKHISVLKLLRSDFLSLTSILVFRTTESLCMSGDN